MDGQEVVGGVNVQFWLSSLHVVPCSLVSKLAMIVTIRK
jgi:hypothetical protein